MKKMMAFFAIVIGSVAAGAAAPIELHVSPSGNDSNPGTREKPLATPAGARDALRRMRAAVADARERVPPDSDARERVPPDSDARERVPPDSDAQERVPPDSDAQERVPPDSDAQERVPPAEVVFEDGVYRLSEPVRLDARDGSNVTWRAANRGKAVFSGALTPAGWKKVDDPVILELLPESARGHVVMADIPQGLDLPGFRGGGCGTPAHLQEIPLSLFQGERRLESARWPNEGFVRTGDNVGKMEKRHDATYCRSGVFKFSSPRLAQWAKEPELWTYGLWCYEWADAKARVLAIDPSVGTISVDPSPIGFGIRENAQFRVLNAISEIDRPGEWVIDRAARRVYLWPVGSDPIRFAAAPGLVDARDMTDVTFDGFVFEYARTTAVRFNNSVRAKVFSSVFRHTSSWGVKVARGTDCRVEGCDMYDLGEGGVSLEGGDFKALAPGNNVADNNHIHHYGLVVPNYRPGVQLDGVGNRCTHNLIHHTLHQAVAFGGNDHVIGFNVCHDCCMFNDDAGTIYCCQRDWSKRGTVIEHNVIHMTGKQPRATHTEAIYLDDYSSGVTVRGNIINRASQGVHVGGGQDCDVSGNVFMNCGTSISLGSRGIETFARGISSKGRESGMFKRLEQNRALFEGPLWKSRYPNMMRVFDFPDAQHAHDAHFNRITNNVCVTSGPVSKGNWKHVSVTCVVTNNLEIGQDPGFEDYARFGWDLKPGPARDMVGALRFAEIGLYDSPRRVSPAVKFAADVTPPRPLRLEYALAVVRVDLPFTGKSLPDGVTQIAEPIHRCNIPDWGRGKRIVASFGQAPDTWREYAFAFTPTFDATLVVETMGARGEKTLYDDFRVEGAELKNGGFESSEGWGVPRPNKNDYRAPMCNLEKPWGIITAVEAGVPAAEGEKMACGSDMLNFTQRIRVRKGVPVKISFKARALPIKD